VPAHGRVDGREATTEPALLLTLRRERLLAVRERLPLLREGLPVRRLLLERLLSVRCLRLAILLTGLAVRLALLRLAGLSAVPLARLL
jgi:hypothetical protein